MSWVSLTFPSSSRGILSSGNSNSPSIISTPNLKQIAVSHPPSSHLGHPYPQCPKHMAAINALLLLRPSRSRAPREYQRLIRVLIVSAFSEKEILSQNPSTGGPEHRNRNTSMLNCEWLPCIKSYSLHTKTLVLLKQVRSEKPFNWTT